MFLGFHKWRASSVPASSVHAYSPNIKQKKTGAGKAKDRDFIFGYAELSFLCSFSFIILKHVANLSLGDSRAL